MREAEIFAEHFPQEADRVRIFECLDMLDLRADALVQRRARGLTDAVDGEDRCAIEAGREERRRGMRQMMRHEMKSRPERTPKKLVDGALHLAEPQPEGFFILRVPPFGAVSLVAEFG